MNFEDMLFPPGYWCETKLLPPLRLVRSYGTTSARIMRYYVNQEGGQVMRLLDIAVDEADAMATLETLTRAINASKRRLKL